MLTSEEAIRIAKSGVWKKWSDDEVVKFQLYQNYLCMNFSRYHEAIEHVLGRGVWTHEFIKPELLQAEYEGKRTPPTVEEIYDMLVDMSDGKPIISIVV
jgi:hypothetical protein